MDTFFFQVAIPRFLELLEAEGWALLVGARLAAALNLQVVNFLTDNEILAGAAKRSSRHYHGHWSLRPILAEFIQVTNGMQHSIIKVNRDTNKVVDRLAKQARQATIPSSCLFSCEANVHSNQCNVQSALQNIDWGMFCPISVPLSNAIYLFKTKTSNQNRVAFYKLRTTSCTRQPITTYTLWLHSNRTYYQDVYIRVTNI